jgi:predicted RNA-binding protein with TRAM domain
LDGDFGGYRQSSPVNVGDEFDVEIETIGEKGDGLAKVKGFVLFMPGTKEGDKVKVRVTKVFRKVGFAEIVDSE